MTWGPLRLRTVSEGITFDGEASPAPGGGSMPKYGAYSSPNTPPYSVTIADGASAALPWEFSGDGEELLDLTDPTVPVVLAAGVYSVTGYVLLVDGPLTAGGGAQGILSVGNVGSQAMLPGGITTPDFLLSLGLTAVGVLDAGEAMSALVLNDDGAASHDFRIGSFYVVKSP